MPLRSKPAWACIFVLIVSRGCPIATLVVPYSTPTETIIVDRTRKFTTRCCPTTQSAQSISTRASQSQSARLYRWSGGVYEDDALRFQPRGLKTTGQRSVQAKLSILPPHLNHGLYWNLCHHAVVRISVTRVLTSQTDESLPDPVTSLFIMRHCHHFTAIKDFNAFLASGSENITMLLKTFHMLDVCSKR